MSNEKAPMKHLIYLNKEYLYSYYAQAFDGIDELHQKGVADANAQTEQHVAESVGQNLNFGLSLPGVASFSAGKNTTEGSINTTFYELEFSRDYANVVLHDNALDHVIEQSSAKENADDGIGQYVIEKGHFSIIDMQYLEELTSPLVIDFMADASWDDHVKSLGNPNASEVQKGKKAFLTDYKRNLTDTNRKFQALKAMAMFDSILIINNKLVPLKKQCMKESTKEIVFKYESEISVFGRITRKNQAMLNNSMGLVGTVNQATASMWFTLLETLQLTPNQNYTVIDPIAIYVE